MEHFNLGKASAFRFAILVGIVAITVSCGSKRTEDSTTTPTDNSSLNLTPTMPSPTTDLTGSDLTAANNTGSSLAGAAYDCGQSGQVSNINDLLNRAAYHYVRGVYRDGGKVSQGRGISGRAIGNPFATRGLRSARGVCGTIDSASYDLGGLASNGAYGVGDLGKFLLQILLWIFQSFRGGAGWNGGQSFYGFHPQLFSPFQTSTGHLGDGLLPFNHAWYAGPDYRP